MIRDWNSRYPCRLHGLGCSHLIPLVELDCSKIRSHINECESSHGTTCRPTSSSGLHNLRVIDCKRRVVVAAPKHCRYVALWYIWDKTTDTSQTHLIAELPQTIEDSISVTLRLGYEFLWIDRYVSKAFCGSARARKASDPRANVTDPLQCIDQHNGDETLRQIMQMADIYSAAQITIVAAAEDDPSRGLPGSHKSRGFVGKIRDIYLFKNPNRSLVHPFRAKWFNRAWTYQECYFAKRRLFFSEYHIVFMCNHGTDSHLPATTRLTDTPLFDEKSRTIFLEVMRNCTSGPCLTTGAQSGVD